MMRTIILISNAARMKAGNGTERYDDHKDEDNNISFGVFEEWRFNEFVVSHLPRVEREVSLTWIIRYLY